MTRRLHEDAFFVGYLPVDAAHARAMRRVGIAIGIGALVLGPLIAGAQRDPGDGAWPADSVSVRGTLLMDPYPSIRTTDDQGVPERVLLAESDKTGAAPRARPIAGRLVEGHGTIIERGGVRMLALLPEPGALAAVEGAPARAPSGVASGEVELRGFIADPKCYLGAMKPGEGKPHRACAALCLLGGIPPALIGEDGSLRLLCDEEGRALRIPPIVHLVDERVVVTGSIVRADNIELVYVRAGGIVRD